MHGETVKKRKNKSIDHIANEARPGVSVLLVALLLLIQEVSGSNFDSEFIYPDRLFMVFISFFS